MSENLQDSEAQDVYNERSEDNVAERVSKRIILRPPYLDHRYTPPREA